MPDNSLSAAVKEAYASAPSDDIIYHTLDFNHPQFDHPVYIVHGFDDIAPTDGTGPYTAMPFSLQLPEVTNQSPPQLKIEVDNVSRDLLFQIELAAEDPQPIVVAYRMYLLSDMSRAQNNPPLQLHISAIDVTQQTISATAAVQNFTNRRFPSRIYRDDQYPGLLR